MGNNRNERNTLEWHNKLEKWTHASGLKGDDIISVSFTLGYDRFTINSQRLWSTLSKIRRENDHVQEGKFEAE